MRTIKSFVRRTGRTTSGQHSAIEQLWSEYGVDFSKKKLNFYSLFRNDYPVHLEIGFGDGEALIANAECNPNKNYFGIEVYESGIGSCLIKAKKRQINNIKICSGDARDVLVAQIVHKSLERINIYFPDPWPKKRHHKRRLIQKDFLDLCASKLKKNGQIVLEIGYLQAKPVKKLLTVAGFSKIRVHKDLDSRDRVLSAEAG